MSFPTEKKYLKVTLCLKKRDDLTNEQFSEYWRTTHADLALSNKTFMDKVRRYNQHHATPEMKEVARSWGNPTLDFDGIAEVWVDDLEAWQEISADQDFLDKILPDEKQFLKHPITIMLGYDNTVIGDRAPR
ncbi:uncharacterized protein LTR77_000680 [Saxophila tyrrhenica]|uniref:EthD domain-containing protein n=1 Tax=Saxophila tyrrhenica TaxID=1690608 RepID=A0AAV9PNI0_9PEZI|nr:hypothetical protein LTR77_000680 [Saxophila tyrrhenica]